MKDLFIRAASGVLYITILLGSLFISKYVFIVVILALCLITCIEYYKLRKQQWLKLLPLVLLVVFAGAHAFVHATIYYVLIAGLALATNLYLVYWLFKGKNEFSEVQSRIILAGSIILGFLAISLIPLNGPSFQKEVMIGVLLMLWGNDTFAYLVGKNIGKTKLMPSVSPKKTIEGFLGGALGAIGIGIALSFYYQSFSLIMWLTLALIVVVFGSIGDLVQSRFKRIAGVKDSGTIMPGHGGIYDRLDSLIFAAPFIYIYLILVCYVS